MSDLVGYLTFCSYKRNRQISPEVKPEQWKRIFGAATEQLEAQYQEEKRSASTELTPCPTCGGNEHKPCSCPVEFKPLLPRKAMPDSPSRAYQAACNHWNECSICRTAGGEWADPEDLCDIGRQLTKVWAEAEKRFARMEEDFWDSRAGTR